MSKHLPSTLRRVVTEKPLFDEKRLIAQYEKLPSNGDRRYEAGLRLQNKFKSGSDSEPLVTYITIVRNNKSGIIRCMESVWEQTYDNVEYIVIDGNSNDGTAEYILQHADKIDYYVSEPDKGIYNAFNKALSLASGNVINILNSDDSLYEDSAAKAVASMGHSDILFGTAMYFNEEGKQLYPHHPFEMHEGTIFIGTPVCHNAVYASSNAYEQVGYYREDIKIASDFKWMLDAWRMQLSIAYSPELLVKYALGGVSDNIDKFFADMRLIIQEFFPELDTEEVKLLFDTFCMFLPSRVILDKHKEELIRVVNRHSHNSSLALSILKCMIVKTYQYDAVMAQNASASSGTRRLKAAKDYVYLKTRNTVFHKPLKKVYRFIRGK